MLTLRDYQAASIEAAWRWVYEHKTPPVIVLPTGAGKTAVLAAMAADVVQKWGGRAIVISHVAELIDQGAESMRRWFPLINTTVYHAGLDSRDLSGQVVFAGVQSLAAGQFAIGAFNVVIIDEAHCIPSHEDSQYQRTLERLRQESPNLILIGLTATPYRLDGGLIYGDGKQFNGKAFEAGVADLIKQGYLSKLSATRQAIEADLSKVKKSKGEFDLAEMEDEFIAITAKAVLAILESAEDRKSVLIFACGIEHAGLIHQLINGAGHKCETILGGTDKEKRRRIATDFKANRVKYLVNVGVLTTGFDATCVDMVCLLRATLSPGLFYQMVGRGLRLHDGKDYCRILDFGGNIRRHGCIDAINPPKGGTKNFELVWECKRCEEINATGEDVCKRCELPKDATKCTNSECGGWLLKGQDVCPDCGATRPQQDPEARHETQAEDAPILSEEVKAVWVPVTETYYAVHAKRGADEWAPKTLRVSYFDGLAPIADEWICVEHIGFARIKAERWWNARSNSFCPTLASQAVELAKLGAIATTTAIKIVQKPGSKFPEIVGHQTCSKPPKVSQEDWVKNYDADEEPPF